MISPFFSLLFLSAIITDIVKLLIRQLFNDVGIKEKTP